MESVLTWLLLSVLTEKTILNQNTQPKILTVEGLGIPMLNQLTFPGRFFCWDPISSSIGIVQIRPSLVHGFLKLAHTWCCSAACFAGSNCCHHHNHRTSPSFHHQSLPPIKKYVSAKFHLISPYNPPKKNTKHLSTNNWFRTSPAKRLAKAIPLVNCLTISQTCKGRPWSKTIGPLPAAPPAKRGRKTKPMTFQKAVVASGALGSLVGWLGETKGHQGRSSKMGSSSWSPTRHQGHQDRMKWIHISIIWHSYLGGTWYWCKMYHEIAPFPPQKKILQQTCKWFYHVSVQKSASPTSESSPK